MWSLLTTTRTSSAAAFTRRPSSSIAARQAACRASRVTRRARTGHGGVSRVSLARVAHWLTSGPPQNDEPPLELPLAGPLDTAVYDSPAGPVRRLRWPMRDRGIPFRFDRPGDPFGSSVPCWIG